LFGTDVFDDPAHAFDAIARAIAAFEQSALFAPFDSRYDRYLRGELTLTPEEDLGRRFFFSDLMNCSRCHLAHTLGPVAREPFTNYRYHNVGVPANAALAAAGGAPPGGVDRGLADHAQIGDHAQAGKFKVPTLRNVAVTAPYMHNGVFASLDTAIHFYNRHIVDSSTSRINPETGAVWAPAEVAPHQARDLLRLGQPMDAGRIAAVRAFLRALTDRRYEHLLDER
jgi:cytochrome c peroxidase